MMNRQDVKTIIILLIIFATIFAIVYLFTAEDRNIKKTSEYVSFVALEDESLFLSVSEGINYFFEAINSNDNVKALNLLDDDYIRKNEISSENILNKFQNYNGTSFKASTIDVISRNNNYAFLIEGYVINNVFEESANIKEKSYFILNYDIVSSDYLIEQISQKKYNKYKKDKKILPVENINKGNNLILKSYNEESLSLYYFNDVISNIYDNPDYIYERLGETTKNNYFNTYDKFIDYIKKNSTFENVYLKKYNKINNLYKLIDNKNNEYNITVSHGLNYSINIKINESEN